MKLKMNELFEDVWSLTVPYLEKGVVKDLVVHTEGVVKAMELLLAEEEGDKFLLLPAAILHDVGWSKVPVDLQKRRDKEGVKMALELHLEYASPVIREILTKLRYGSDKIDRIVEVVKAHKFQDPSELEKQLLIDADSLSDCFREQFYSDARSYVLSPEKLYEFRLTNKFYSPVARRIFDREMEERRKEFERS
jgi:hypothetical protein